MTSHHAQSADRHRLQRLASVRTKRLVRRVERRIARKLQALHQNQSGASTLEWVLLLAAIALPCYWILSMALATLVAHQDMVKSLIHLPML